MTPLEKLLTAKNGNDSKKDDDLLKFLGESVIKGADLFLGTALKYPKEFETYLNNLKSDDYTKGVYDRLNEAADTILGKDGTYQSRKIIINGFEDKDSAVMKGLDADEVSEEGRYEMRSGTIVREAADAAEVYGIINAHKKNIDLLKKINKYYLDCLMTLTAKRVNIEDPRKAEALDGLIGDLRKTYGTGMMDEIIAREEKLIVDCKERIEEHSGLYINEKERPESLVSELDDWIYCRGIEAKVTEPHKKEIIAVLEEVTLNELKACGIPEIIYDAILKEREWVK
jgi:hypothetical protein